MGKSPLRGLVDEMDGGWDEVDEAASADCLAHRYGQGWSRQPATGLSRAGSCRTPRTCPS